MLRLCLAVLLILGCTGSAMFMRPEWVPVDRLVRNTARYVEANPNDAAGHYALGRLHYLAFTLKMELVPSFPKAEGELARPVPDHLIGLPLAGAREQRAIDLAREELGAKADSPEGRQQFFQAVSRHREKLEAENWRPQKPSPEVLVDHASRAVAELSRAMELDGRDPLFPLGLGSLFAQFAEWQEETRLKEVPESLRGDLRKKARALFLTAWNLAYPTESKARRLPIGGLSQFVSFEAGHAFLRLAEAEPNALSPEEKEVMPKMRTGVAALEKLPIGAITPLVLSLKPRGALDQMLAAGAPVEFDLSGLGRRDVWQWVPPEVGILVWDPLRRCEIKSGRQLFGNFSYRAIWRNGFEALRALDDDGDGRVADSELHGIAVWFDRDGDGVSTTKEVVPVERLEIRALACEATDWDGEHLRARDGVKLSNGGTLPLWDWMASPIEEASRPFP